MAEIVRMPKLSDTMTEGVVSKWHKKVGDPVTSGDLLADIETDKATMEFESFQDGVLLYRGVEEGKGAPVDSILAILGQKGEDIKPLLNKDKQEVPKAEISEQKKQDIQPEVATTKESEKKEEHFVVQDSRLKASPLAKRLAKEKNIDISTIKGTGDGGRIIKKDIESYSPTPVSTISGKESYKEEAVSQMRKTIARRLSESKFTAPHFYLTVEINMDKAVEARNTLNDSSPVKISFNDLVIKAAAAALRKHPKVNVSWLGDKIRYYDHIHIGVAVAVEEGLLVPVVRFADTKSLSQLAAEVKSYGQKAKEKKLQPSDWEGNTFTISNLGMFGIDEFTAIINPPDACILAVGGIKEIPVVRDGQIVSGNVMKVTLSCDHRIVDGATGAAFLQTFKDFLENPVTLLI